jgi:hypothetical protein
MSVTDQEDSEHQIKSLKKDSIQAQGSIMAAQKSRNPRKLRVRGATTRSCQPSHRGALRIL